MSLTSGTPAESSVIKTELVLPSNTNAQDSVFGGTIMSWVDIAAAISAGKHSEKSVVTASIDALNFIAPAYAGWVVELRARVNQVYKTSMEVGVRVDSIPPRSRKKIHTASAYLTFVALDHQGNPAEVPKLNLETEEDKRRAEAAIKRRQSRLKLRKTVG